MTVGVVYNKINNVYYVSRSNDMGEYYLTEVELID
jgi:hypothetical protein